VHERLLRPVSLAIGVGLVVLLVRAATKARSKAVRVGLRALAGLIAAVMLWSVAVSVRL
jgi:type III secretory pathway component EscS